MNLKSLHWDTVSDERRRDELTDAVLHGGDAGGARDRRQPRGAHRDGQAEERTLMMIDQN